MSINITTFYSLLSISDHPTYHYLQVSTVYTHRTHDRASVQDVSLPATDSSLHVSTPTVPVQDPEPVVYDADETTPEEENVIDVNEGLPITLIWLKI